MVDQASTSDGRGQNARNIDQPASQPWQASALETKELQAADSDSSASATPVEDNLHARRPHSHYSADSHDDDGPTYEPYANTKDDDAEYQTAGRRDFENDLEKATTTGTNRTTASGRMVRVGTIGRRRYPEEGFTHPLSHVKTGADVLVDFDGDDDPYKPLNWTFKKKAITTALYGFTTMGATMSSSIYSPAVDPIAAEFGIGSETSLLGISLYLLGFGLGPLAWGPFSELYGRKAAVLYPFFIGAMFNFGAGAGKDIQTVLICRFFAGLFGSAPVTNTGGVLGDIWPAAQRGTAIVAYAFAVVGGPVFGPIIGSAFIVSGVGWRWTQYLVGIFMTVIFFLDEIFLDETYAPVLLTHKAQHLRVKTQNWALHAKHEEWDPTVKEMVMKFGVRPFQMILTPICFCVALYASFVYGVFYANLSGFPVEFQETRGWNPLVGSLPFISLLIGLLIGGVVNILNNQFYIKRSNAAGGKPVPEARLPPMMFGSFFLSGGLFMFGWTSSTDYHWILPNIGAVLVGTGFLTIFQAALNYLIDTFQRYAASAVAANTFLRSMFALSFPLFVGPMYDRIGIDWGTSVFGFFSVLLIPIPFLFYVYGPALRKKGKYSANIG